MAARGSRQRAPTPGLQDYGAPVRGDERRVVEAFCAHLTAQGWDVQTEVDFADVVATRDGRRLIAEAKGRTSEPGLDVDTLYGQLLRRISGGGNERYAVVVPGGRVTSAALRVPAAVRQALRIEVFSVDDAGDVTSA